MHIPKNIPGELSSQIGALCFDLLLKSDDTWPLPQTEWSVR